MKQRNPIMTPSQSDEGIAIIVQTSLRARGNCVYRRTSTKDERRPFCCKITGTFRRWDTFSGHDEGERKEPGDAVSRKNTLWRGFCTQDYLIRLTICMRAEKYSRPLTIFATLSPAIYIEVKIDE